MLQLWWILFPPIKRIESRPVCPERDEFWAWSDWSCHWYQLSKAHRWKIHRHILRGHPQYRRWKWYWPDFSRACICRGFISYNGWWHWGQTAKGPRCKNGKLGPVEEALIGTPVADPKNPLEILRTVHSFDPCIACAVHVIDPDSNQVYKVKVL